VLAIGALKYLATCLIIDKQYDDAIDYLKHALRKTEAVGDTAAYADILSSLGVAYGHKGDCQQAKTYALASGALIESMENLLNIALIYDCQNRYDSAAFYAHRIAKQCDRDSLSYPASLYELLAKIEKQNRRFDKALAYQEKYTQQVFKINEKERAQSLAGIEAKYDKTRLQNKNQQLEIDRLNTRILIITIFLTIVVIIGLEGFFWKKQKSKKRLKKVKEKCDALFERQINAYKNAEQLDICLMAQEANEQKAQKIRTKVYQIYYGSDDGPAWKNFYALINYYHDGRFDRIRKRLPQLDDMEFKMACLEYFQFKNEEIAMCTNRPKNTVSTKKTSMHKKLGFEGKRDIKRFFDSLAL
jgi:tetratricopeptide (TPR) repeat protein